jgi:hypothetical protein
MSAHHDDTHQKDSKTMRSQVPPSHSLPNEESKTPPIKNPDLTCTVSGSAHISSSAWLLVAPDAARRPELVPTTAVPRKCSTLPGRMKKVMQRVWAGNKRDRKATRAAQMMDEPDTSPPQYTEFAGEVVEEASFQKLNESTSPKTSESAVSKANRITVSRSNGNDVPKLNKDAYPKPIGSNDQKPIKSNAQKPEKSTVVKSIPGSQREVDYRAFSYPRLTALTRNEIDMVKLLRSILVFVMFITFHADLDKINTDTSSLFPWNTTIFTRTDTDPSKFFAWDVFEITRDLSTLVRHLEQQVRGNRWFNIRRQHKDLLTKLVLRPAEDLRIQADYTLEILGAFRQDRLKDGSIDYYSLVDHWKPRNRGNLPICSYRMLDLGDTLASHASLITSLNLQEKQQSELEDAMAKYLKKRNLNELQMSEALKLRALEESKLHPHETCCWPMRDGYMDLFRMLGKTYSSCWRDDLKLERKRRRGQSALPSPAIGGTG